MFLKNAFLLSLCLPIAASAQPSSPPSEWLPDDAVIAIEFFQPTALLKPLLDEKNGAMITALPALQKQLDNPGFKKFQQIVGALETQLGTDWRSGLATLTGGGVAFAVCPQQRTVFVTEATDEHLLTQLHETIAKAASKGESGRATSQSYGDVTGWSFNGKEAHAIVGKRFVAGNDADSLQTALALRGKHAGLAATSAYRDARRTVGPDAVGMIYLNMEVLKQVPGIAKFLKPEKREPIGALLFAGITESASASKWLALGLHVKECGLALQLVSDAAKREPNSVAGFALPEKREEGALPNLTVPRQIAAASFYRDLHRFYAAKDQLFPERTSGLIFFENMMGIFFSGRDLTDDVMAQARPEIRFVAANQEYDSAVGTPVAPVPAFAAVLRMREPAKFKEIVEEAWQKSIGLASFTRGQRAEQGFIIDRPIHWGTKYSVARFSMSAVKDRAHLDTRFNFSPTLAMPGNYLILSSTEALACDLMDAVAREAKQPPQPVAQVHSMLEIDGDKVAAALEANRTVFVRRNMISEGGSENEKHLDIDGIIADARAIDRLRLNLSTQGGLNQASLELTFKSPSPATQKVAAAK